MKIEIAITLAVTFGSLYTIFRKYQCVLQLNNTTKQFNQPMIQAFIIFIGMTLIYFFQPFIPKQTDQPNKKPQRKYIYLVPSLLDVLGTILDTTGLFYTSVSVSQMLKGSTLFFTYLISIFFNIKKLNSFQHFYMLTIVLSLGIIGYSNINSADHKYQSNPFLGNSLIVASQLIFALMFISQQKITKNYNIQISNAVLWQGIWGVVISGALLLAFSNMNSSIIKCDVFQSCNLLLNNWKLFAAVLTTSFCIAPFNYFGLMITRATSALQRCMVCTSRMMIIWLLSIVFGWEPFSIVQLVGYVILALGIYQFNKYQVIGKSQSSKIQQQQTIQNLKQYEIEHEIHNEQAIK